MFRHHAGTTSPADRATDPPPCVVGAVDVARVVVPLDGSPFAERALPVAAWARSALAADIQLVGVVAPGEQPDDAGRYLEAVAHRYRATQWDVLRCDDVARALADTVARPRAGIACLATHGRDRGAALFGSVAASLLGCSDHPVLLAGPSAGPVEADDAPIVVAVDGTPGDESLVPVALTWTKRLGRRLVITTVAEPVPRSYRPGGAQLRARGPDDPEGYVEALAARAATAGVPVEARVVYDPVSVRNGLVPSLDRAVALVVIGSRSRRGVSRMVVGSHAARVVHDAAVPALAVPLRGHPGRRRGGSFTNSRGADRSHRPGTGRRR